MFIRRIKNEKQTAIIISYVNIIVTNLVNLFYIPILLRQLGAEEYGLFSLCSSLVEYLAVINLGYASAYIKYYSNFRENHNEQKIRSLNGIMLGIYVCLGAIVLVSGIILVCNIEFVIGDKFGEHEYELAGQLVLLLTINLSITFPGSVFEAVTTAHEKFIFQRVLEILRNLLIPLAGSAFLLMGFHSLSIAVIMLAVTGMWFTANCIYCLFRLKISFSFKEVSWSLVWDILGFSFFLLLQSIADCMNWQVDKLILARVAGSVAIACYTVGAKINSMIMNFSGAIYSVFIPKINRLIAKDKYNQDVTVLFAKIGRIQFMVIAYIYMGFLLVGEEFIGIWAGSGYHNSFIVAALLACPLLVQSPMQTGVVVLRAQDKNGLLNVFYLGICIINILISIPLSLNYGEIGAALGSCISLIVAWGIIAIVFFERNGRMNMRWVLKEIYRTAVGMVFAFIFTWIITRFVGLSGIYAVIIYGILYTLLYWGIVYIFSMNTEEKNIVKRVLNNKK